MKPAAIDSSYTKQVRKYFEEDSKNWLVDQYGATGEYSVAANRNRIVSQEIKTHFPKKSARILEIGSGGGNFCMLMKKLGYNITGVEASRKMYLAAKKNFAENSLSPDEFINSSFEEAELGENTYDVIVALGVYEYIIDTKFFLQKIKKHLNPKGLVIMDFRNKLFNMISISPNTLREIEAKKAAALVTEIEELIGSAELEQLPEFQKEVKKHAKLATEFLTQEKVKSVKKSTIKYSNDLEGTQQSPKEIEKYAASFGLVKINQHGVHPHLVSPYFRRILPKMFCDQLSESLRVYENSPASLLWSSKFLMTFRNDK